MTDAYNLNDCWRCGTKVPKSNDPAVLCANCKSQVYGTATFPVLGTIFGPGGAAQHGVYWDGHDLSKCWVCCTNEVDPDPNGLGACEECAGNLKEKSSG